MKLEQFLSTVVPGDGYIYVARKRNRADGGSYFVHEVFEDATDAAAYIRKNPDKELYFATASFENKETEKDGKLRPDRSRNNAKLLKSLFFDIDCGEGKGYATKADAAKALKSFCETIGISWPTFVIDSGGGLHTYWVFDRALSLPEWTPLAEALKQAALSNGLRIDPAVTADAARVLRPIETTNQKRALPVKLVTEGDIVTVDTMRQKLRVNLLQPLQGGVSWAKDADANDELSAGAYVKERSYYTKSIIENCPVFEEIAATHGKNCSEPLWKDMLHTISFTEDGREYIHALSDGHPTYSQQATETKFVERFNLDRDKFGPITCKRFSEHSNKCQSCIYNGTIKSPIVLGQSKYNPVVPYPWRLIKGVLHLKEDGDEGSGTYVELMPNKLSNFNLFHDHENIPTLTFTNTLGHSISHCELKATTLGSNDKWGVWCLQNRLFVTGEKLKGLKGFMVGFIKNLTQYKKPQKFVESFGWVEHGGEVGFAIPDNVFWSNGQQTSDVRDIHNVSEHFRPKGELSEWKSVADFLTTQNNPSLCTVLASAFAAPLVELTGLEGLFVSVVSRDSGTGKTSALRTAQAVWGHPKFCMHQLDDTANSVVAKLGITNSLPAYWDEIRIRKDVENFVRMVFQLSQGKEKTRLNSSIEQRTSGNWRTLLVGASNTSILDAMDGLYAETPGYFRVFEMTVNKNSGQADLFKMLNLFNKTSKNYGHAGKIYAKFLAKDRNEIKKLLAGVQDKITKDLNPEADERFWTATVLVLIVGAMLANHCKLTNFDINSLTKHLYTVFNLQRKKSVAEISSQSLEGVIARYISSRQSEMLITDIMLTSHGASTQPTVVKEPKSGRVSMQYASNMGSVRIDVSDFRKWLRANGIPQKSTFEDIYTSQLFVQEGKFILGEKTLLTTGVARSCIDISFTVQTTGQSVI